MSPQEPTPQPLTPDRTQKSPEIRSTGQQSLSLIDVDTHKPANAHECGQCDNWWTGYATAHCGGCRRTFSSITAFDAHRTGSHSQGERHCVVPASVGLVDAGRAYPCWAQPGSYNPREDNQ